MTASVLQPALPRRGWSPKVKKRRPEAVARAGQIMLLSAGNGGGAVLPKAMKRRRNAVARAAGFHLRKQVKEGKRDS